MIEADSTRLHWRKSSRSNGQLACVELAFSADAVGVRDSKAPAAGQLTISPTAFHAFLTHAKSGGFEQQR